MKTQASEWVSNLKKRAKFYAWCFPLIFLSWYKINRKYLFQFEVHTLSKSIPST